VVGDEALRGDVAALMGDGVAVALASSAAAALDALGHGPPDCLVLDLRLAELEAFQVLEALRGDGGGVPVVVRADEGLTLAEQAALRGYADALVIRQGSTRARLVREVALCLHRPWIALPEEARRLLAEPNGAGSELSGRRVLIVDDDERNVFALRSALALRGMDVAVAEDGAAALAALERDPDVDLVLMDVMMPELDGYETTKAIRRQPRFSELPVIALTAKAMKGDREKSIEAGATDYIAKPVEIAELLALMRMWIAA
jgi:CheY-like chemotaxis protein